VADFDGNAYRKTVLAKLISDFSAADPETGDPFFLFDLDPQADQATAIARFGDVVAFWQKERNSVKYKGIAADLVKARARYEAVLTDPARRSAAAARVSAERASVDRERFADLDRLAGQLTTRFGGIPAEKVDQLQLLARRSGTDDQAFADWLGRQQVLAANNTEVRPWDPAIRRQIRAQLTELARGSAEPATFATLWTWLDLSPHASDAELAERHAERLAENQRSRHDNAKTRTGELLAHVKTRLMAEGGRDGYAASLRADATDLIYQDVAEKALVAGEVSAADYELLVQRVVALGWGISNDDARAAVRTAATSLGASLAIAPAVDYLVCGHCGQPQQAPGSAADRAGARCRYCSEALYRSCPNCEHVVEAAAVTCPDCGTSFKAHRELVVRLGRARELLAAGRPVEAGQLLDEARTGAAGLEQSGLAELATRIATALTAAAAEWEAIGHDLAARRIWAAYDRTTRLERTAADLAGPDGSSPGQRRAELGKLKAEIQGQVRDAAALPPEDAETALTRVLNQAVDAPEAAAALAGIPLARPSALVVTVGEGVTLEWRPSPAPGPISYRVVRVATTRPDQPPSRSTIATTSATSLEDAGAPGGTELVYELTALAGRRRSDPVISESVLVTRDISALRAEVSDDGIELRWAALPGGGAVLIERSTVLGGGGGDGGGGDGDDAVESGPRRRIRPTEANRYLDPDVVSGPHYGYRVFVEYRLPGQAPILTEGRTVTVQVPPRPVPVTDLWARTDESRTTLSFATPPDGEVRIYAGTEALAEPGTWLDPEAAFGGRLVGSGRRRVIDPLAVGRVVYTPVTVVAERAIVGTALEHLAIGRVSNLAAVDRGDSLLLTFDLPHGATEALVRWRFGRAPTGLDDADAVAAKVTNTKLEIAGGFEITAPDDGRALHVAVYPGVRIGHTLAPGPYPAVLEARPARPVEVRYRVLRTGLLRRTVRVEIEAGPDAVPPVVLVARAGPDAPVSPGAGIELASSGGEGHRSVAVELALDRFPAGLSTLRLFLTGRPDRPTRVLEPDPAELAITR
jgi:hypothetical protein